MVLEIFHRGSINLIKSLSTGEITIFLTFGKRIIISFKEIWLAEDVEWGKITKSERRQSIYKCIKVPITLANESIRVLAKTRWLSDNISLSDESITNKTLFLAPTGAQRVAISFHQSYQLSQLSLSTKYSTLSGSVGALKRHEFSASPSRLHLHQNVYFRIIQSPLFCYISLKFLVSAVI